MKYLLKRYRELSRKERKGFTLVELLVVIAILAVLASVSVVGYLGFTTKARNSNAVTELAQVRELLRAELIDGEVHKIGGETEGTISMKYVDKNYYILDVATAPTENTGVKYTDEFTKHSDLASIPGDLYVFFSTTAANVDNGESANDYEVLGILYVRNAGGSANWVVSTDAINPGNGTYTVPTAA